MTGIAPGWSGVFPSLCTPFTGDGAVDLDGQHAVTRFALSCGADGIVCLGLAAEVGKLTADERRRIAETILAEVDGSVPVLVGVGAEALHTTLALAEHAQRSGAAGVVLLPPFTTGLGTEQAASYYAAVARGTELPVVLQEPTNDQGLELTPEFATGLAAVHANVRYVKLERGPEAIASWIAECSGGVAAFSGDAGANMLSAVRAGAVGMITGVEFADVIVKMWRAERGGDRESAESLQRAILPYLAFSVESQDYYNACTKQVLVRRGVLSRAGVRSPGPVLSPFAVELIERCVQSLAF